MDIQFKINIIEESQKSEFVIDCIETLLREESIVLPKAILILSHYWKMSKKDIRKYLRGSKFDGMSLEYGSNPVWCIVNNEEIRLTKFLNISGMVLSKLLRNIINQTNFSIGTAASLLLHSLGIPETNCNIETLGKAVRAHIKTTWGLKNKENVFDKGFSEHIDVIQRYKSHGCNVEKVLGKIGTKCLNLTK